MKLDFTRAPARPQAPPGGKAFNAWTIDEERCWLEFYRNGEDYLLRFPDLADFEVSRDGRSIAAAPVPGVGEGTLEHLFLNQVRPLSLNLQGRLAFHASAVAVGGYAIAFFGATGRGKSTLAASFARNGYPFLTEDVLEIRSDAGRTLALPSHPSIRLWDDSAAKLVDGRAREVLPVEYTTKARYLAGCGLAHFDRPLPLLAAYHLGDGSASRIVIEAKSPSQCVVELIRQSFQLDIENSTTLKRHFVEVAEFCATIPCHELDYPRDYHELDATRAAIIAHAAALERK